MTASEVEAIIAEGRSCAGGECAVDEVDDLIATLKAQEREVGQRMDEIDGIIKGLESLNVMEDRPVDEMRETVRAIFRIFALGVSMTTPRAAFV